MMCSRKGSHPLAHHAAHVCREPGTKPSVGDLRLCWGFMCGRAAPSLRSVESQPPTQGFIKIIKDFKVEKNKLLYIKDYYQRSENTTYRMRKCICKFSDKRFLCRIYKEVVHLNNRKLNNQFRNGQRKGLNSRLSKESPQGPVPTWKGVQRHQPPGKPTQSYGETHLRGCGSVGTPTHCWWGCKRCSHCGSQWWFLRLLSIGWPSGLQQLHSWERAPDMKTRTTDRSSYNMVPAALFTVAEGQKQPRCLSRCLRQRVWSIHTMGCYSVIEWNSDIWTAQMDLEDILLQERSQTQGQILYDVTDR